MLENRKMKKYYKLETKRSGAIIATNYMDESEALSLVYEKDEPESIFQKYLKGTYAICGNVYKLTEITKDLYYSYMIEKENEEQESGEC